MNSRNQKEFEKHKRQSYLSDLTTIASDVKYRAVKKCYQNMFDEIYGILQKVKNPRLAIEDIERLCACDFDETFLLLVQNINRGIMEGVINREDFR